MNAKSQGEFSRCPRCSMEARTSEMSVHLAHSHNIGPTVTKDKRRNGRDRRRRDEE
jgi:uncharacterized C2H2 Zn-finger protein